MKSGLDEVILAEIACHSNSDIEVVRQTYQSIVNDISAKAKIHDFIPLLAMNRVRDHFRLSHEKAQNSHDNTICIDIAQEKSLNSHEYFGERYAQ